MEHPRTTKNVGQPCVICGQPANAQATVEALQRERDEYARMWRDGCFDRGEAYKVIVELTAALDAEREKAQGLEQQVQDQSTANLETMRHTDEMQSRALDAERALTQLQALVRAYSEAKVTFDEGRLREDHHAWKERYERLTAAEQALIATLDATS